MNNSSDIHDYTVHSWESIREQYEDAGLLVGNGASRAIWDRYDYTSLYDVASERDLAHPLNVADQAIFESLKTKNFETVLNALRSARLVGAALNQDVSNIKDHYENVKNALIEAVRDVHIPPGAVPEQTLRTIRAELLRYSFVYSTNYDLLLYWAIMSENDGHGFRDYLWSKGFDITNTDVFGKATKILYLHGGLHLVRLPSGAVAKLKWEPGRGILDQFGNSDDSGFVPLFVSEGTATDKESAIRSSDYLTFAFERFTAHQGPLVVFGHSLGENDAHLVRAMHRWGARSIAISIRRGEPYIQRERIALFVHRLPEATLTFFDGSTHPLGSTSLRVPMSPQSESV